MDAISPKYQMTLVRRISEAIWAEYSSYAEALYYIKKWHEHMMIGIIPGKISLSFSKIKINKK